MKYSPGDRIEWEEASPVRTFESMLEEVDPSVNLDDYTFQILSRQLLGTILSYEYGIEDGVLEGYYVLPDIPLIGREPNDIRICSFCLKSIPYSVQKKLKELGRRDCVYVFPNEIKRLVVA